MDNKSGSGRLDSSEPTPSSPATTANGGVVPDSYKQLPDDDVNWQSKNNKTNNSVENLKLKDMGKQNGTDGGGDDEAQEKMLKDDNVKLSVVPSKDKDPSEVSLCFLEVWWLLPDTSRFIKLVRVTFFS